MQTRAHNITPFVPSQHARILEIWEASVRATHLFLSAEDIEFFKRLVSGIDFTSFQVYVIGEAEKVDGFLGIEDGKVEMLFLDPAQIGKGFGKALLHFALLDLGATKVDVNEQNLNAVAFYQSKGFQTYNRTETDSSGKPYPILEMRIPQ